MVKKYYEVVFEGNSKIIKGLLEGFLLGSGENWDYFFSTVTGIKTETMSEKLLEWITLKTKLHHVVMDEDFYTRFAKSLEQKDSNFASKKYIHEAQPIKDASFEFEFATYARKYGDEIKSILNHLPEDTQLHDYSPVEKVNKDGEGVEMYAPEHEYSFNGKGRISGDVKNLIAFKEKLDDHPLINVHDITLVI